MSGIEGVVTDPDGNPLAHAQVMVRAVYGNGAPVPRVSAETDEHGAFTIDTGVPATSFSLEMCVMARTEGLQIYTHVSPDVVPCTEAHVTNVGEIACEPITQEMIDKDASGWCRMALGQER